MCSSNINTENLIVAREEHINKIHDHFEKVLLGDQGVSIIEGVAGVGKTYLVESNIDFFINNNATFVKVKCLQHNKGTLTPIISIINSILDYIFTLPNESYKLIKKNYNNAMGNDGIALLSICPRLKKLFDNKSKRLTNNIKNNIEIVIKSLHQFIKTSSKLLFPLVIFIDDVQWCDKLSFNIINKTLSDAKLNIYIILSYRNNEIKEYKKELSKNQNYDSSIITLREFTKNEIYTYLSILLDNKLEIIDDVVDIIYSLTLGNPFHIKILIEDLIKYKAIYKECDNNTFRLDVDNIKKLNLPHDVEQIIRRKLEQLNTSDKELLEIIACYGGVIKYDTLYCIVEENTLKEALDRLCSKAILVKNQNKEYMFIHDIVFEIIYNHMSQTSKDTLRSYIVNKLVTNRNIDNYNVNITELLLKIPREQLIKSATEYIPILYDTANVIKNMASFEYSLKIFELCEYLAKKNNINDELWLNIQLDYMECEFISENEAQAQSRYQHLINTNKANDLIKIKLKFINFYAYSANWEMVLLLGVEILDNLKLKLRDNAVYKDIILFKYLFRENNIEHIINAPNITDERILNILYILTIMFPAANRIDTKMFTQIVLKLGILTAQYGNSNYSAISYASGCYLLFFVLHQYETGDKLQKQTLKLLDNNDYYKSIPYALIGTFTYHWSNSFKDTIDVLEKSIAYGQVDNEYLFSNYAIVFSIITKYVMGEKLSKIVEYIDESQNKANRLENYLTRHMYEVYTAHIAYLEKGKDCYNYGSDELKRSFHDTIILNYEMIKLHRLYIEGKIRDAYNLAEKIEGLVWKHKGFVLNGDFMFYSTLTRIAIFNRLSNKDKKRNKRIIEKHIRNMHRWGKLYESTHGARYLLMDAEYNYYVNVKEDKDKNYYRAMTYAKKEGNLQLEALSNLLAAKHYNYNLKLSKFYAKEAAILYKKWGAYYIAKVIEKEFGIEVIEQENNTVRSTKTDNDFSNTMHYMSFVNNMTENQTYKYFIEYLLVEYNVHRCAILFENDGEMYAWYDKKKNEEYMIDNQSTNINYIESIPQKLLRYVSRIEKKIILSNNKLNEAFIKDTYLPNLNNTTIACIPIKQDEIMIGIIYLEYIGKEFDKEIFSVIDEFMPIVFTNNKDNHNVDIINIEVKLTKRETEILKLVSQGMSNEEVGQTTFVSVGTVRNHLSNIYRKLEVSSRVQAVIKAKALKILK